MREADRKHREAANIPGQRYHRGALGQVLERYLRSHNSRRNTDYSLVELDQLWGEAARLEPMIGLRLFEHFSSQDWHVVAHLCTFCRDVGQALRYWVRYAPLTVDSDLLELLETEDGVAVEMRIDAPEPLLRYLVEHYGVMAVTQIRRGTGLHIAPARVCFSHARPAYHAAYHEWFGEHIEFGAPHTRLYFDAKTLVLPLQGRHDGVLDLLVQEMDRRLARRRQLGGWAAKTATVARRAFECGQVPSLEGTAESLHQSTRTLRRRLAEQGMNFRELLDQVRAELEQHLELQGVSRSRIAEQLGYADLAAYLHARKRWTAERVQTEAG